VKILKNENLFDGIDTVRPPAAAGLIAISAAFHVAIACFA